MPNQSGGSFGQHWRAGAPAYRHSAHRAGNGPRGSHSFPGPSGADQSVAESGPGIPHAGFRAGEIIGHRLWWVARAEDQSWLCSLAHYQLWRPGETITGNTRERINAAIPGGVYAYMIPSGAFFRSIAYWTGQRRATLRGFDLYGRITEETVIIGPMIPSHYHAMVCGTVKLWGDVVEHQEGYRAEFAKVDSLRAVVWGSADLEDLRRRYLP